MKVMNRKKLVLTGILASIVAVILSGCGASVSNSWSGTMLSYDFADGGTTITARTLNGHSTRQINFDADNLAALRIDSSNDGGGIVLTIAQGDTEKPINISE